MQAKKFDRVIYQSCSAWWILNAVGWIIYLYRTPKYPELLGNLTPGGEANVTFEGNLAIAVLLGIQIVLAIGFAMRKPQFQQGLMFVCIVKSLLSAFAIFSSLFSSGSSITPTLIAYFLDIPMTILTNFAISNDELSEKR